MNWCFNMYNEISIIRSKRKTIAIIVSNNKIIVRTPLKCSDKLINKFVNSKQDWISKQLAKSKLSYKPLNVESGESLTLLENKYTIHLAEINKLVIENDKIILPNKKSKLYLQIYIKKMAKSYLQKRVKEIADIILLNYKSIKISSATTNWGSCGAKNSLNFTYKLMLCPKSVIDYIIVHELCHTAIKNHSANFYNLVKSFMPNYKKEVKWLKENASIINLI